MLQIDKYPALKELVKEYQENACFIDFYQFKQELEKALQYKDDWIDAEQEKPSYNLGVLVYVKSEDHITSGMWDISKKWVLLDEYRKVPEMDITHWRRLPERPVKIEGGDD